MRACFFSKDPRDRKKPVKDKVRAGFIMKIRGAFLKVLILSCCFFFTKPAYCEYNLATGEEEFVFLSSEKEVRMGESLSKQVEKKFKYDENYTNQEKVDAIGQKLADVCDRRDIIFHFKVIDDDKDNAFALPGGYIYIFKGLLDKLDSDDEIAAVLAHEIGHVSARHNVKRLQNSFGYMALRFLLIKGAEDSYSRHKANQAVNELMLSYSREDELEADRLTVKYLERAEYKKRAAISVLDKLIKWQMQGPIRPKMRWYTHPYLAARRAAVAKEITGQMEFEDYINITPDEGYLTPR